MTKVADQKRLRTDADEIAIGTSISIDIGGTFTDCFVFHDGKTSSGKAPTTRHRLAVGFNQAIEDCATKLGVSADELVAEADIVRYATTLAMNALLEKKGPRLGLITTAGFEDTVYIGRGAQWHDGMPVELKRRTARGQRPEPVIPRHMVVGLRERVDTRGEVIIPLDERDTREQIRKLVDRGAMGFVVALMQSQTNSVHELAVRDMIIDEFPEVYLGSQPILLSSEVLSRQNEYQRDMTAILAGYLHRTMADELTELGVSLHDRGYRRPLFIINSQGGANSLHRTSAVETYNAGPVAGIIGGARIADVCGTENIVLTDMGGTSFDIGTVVEAFSRTDTDAATGRHFYSYVPMVDRFRVGISMIETKSIGAGGGSIARYNDFLDLVEVGPDSAGSNPGPAAFDLGGELPTVTDADVALGIIDPDFFLGGKMILNKQRAEQAIEEHLADPLNVTVEEAAYLIKTVVDAKMGNEVFKETNLKGYDPREFTLFAYGGAGPTHCCGYGRYVETPRMMVFPFSSVFSAFGVANTDFMRSYEASCSIDLYTAYDDHWLSDFDAFNSVVGRLQQDALRDASDFGATNVVWSLELYARYGLQPHVTRFRSPRIVIESSDDVQAIYGAFDAEYSRLYSKAASFLAGGVQITGVTLWSTIPTGKQDLPILPLDGPDPATARKGRRRVFWGPDVGWIDSPVFALDELKPGNRVAGPAVVEAIDTTVVLDSQHVMQIDERGIGVIESVESRG